MPPRFKPFSSSLIKGMNNTNQNINNMNQPSNPGVHNPLSQSFTGGGGGNVMGGQQGGAQYGGGSGPSGMEEWDPTWHTTPGAGLGYPGSWSGGITPPEEEKPGLSYIDPRWQSDSFEMPNNIDIPDYLQEQPEQPHEVLPSGWEWQFINGNWEPVQIGAGGGVHEQPSTIGDGTSTYVPPAPPSPGMIPDFAGGGGQGGQAAKKLYYPGTQGGFASVGSGIGGQQNMLDDLLKKLQG